MCKLHVLNLLNFYDTNIFVLNKIITFLNYFSNVPEHANPQSSSKRFVAEMFYMHEIFKNGN